MEVHTFNSNTWEAEAGEFKDSQGCIEKPYLKNGKKKKKGKERKENYVSSINEMY